MAARKCDPFFVKNFIELCAPINSTTLNGINPVHYAAMNLGNKKSPEALEILNILIQKSGSRKVITPDINNFTPIDYVKFCKEARCILLEKYLEELLLPFTEAPEFEEEKLQNNVCFFLFTNLILFCFLIFLFSFFFLDLFNYFNYYSL